MSSLGWVCCGVSTRVWLWIGWLKLSLGVVRADQGSSWKAKGENMHCLHTLAGAYLNARGGSSWQADHSDAPPAPPVPLDCAACWSQEWNITLSLKPGHVTCAPGYLGSSETKEWTRTGILASKQSDCFVDVPPSISKDMSFLWQLQKPNTGQNLFKIFGAFLRVLLLENLANGRNKPALYWLSVKSSQALLRISGMVCRQSEGLAWFYSSW